MKYGALFIAIWSVAASPAIGGDVTEARDVFGRFSKCTVERHAKEAAEVVISDGTSEEMFGKHPGLLTNDCLYDGDSDLKIPGVDFVRYGLAEALVRRDYPRGLPPDISLAAPLSHREINEADYQLKGGKSSKPKDLAELQKRRDRDTAERLLSIFGECVVRANPEAAYGLIETKPSSTQENQAFAGLNAALASCLVSGRKLVFSKGALRGTIAMNLYRLANAPRVHPDAVKAK